jgi:hypothetical protein
MPGGLAACGHPVAMLEQFQQKWAAVLRPDSGGKARRCYEKTKA